MCTTWIRSGYTNTPPYMARLAQPGYRMIECKTGLTIVFMTMTTLTLQGTTCYPYLQTQLLLEVKELLFGKGRDIFMLLVKVTVKARVVNLRKGEGGKGHAYQCEAGERLLHE